MATETLNVTLDFGNAVGGSVPFRYFEDVVASIKRQYPLEHEQKTCMIHGVGALTCTIEHELSPIEMARKEIAQLRIGQKRALDALPRRGADEMADRIRDMLEDRP